MAGEMAAQGRIASGASGYPASHRRLLLAGVVLVTLLLLLASGSDLAPGISRVQESLARVLLPGASVAIEKAVAFGDTALKSVPALAYGVLAALFAVAVAFAVAVGRWLAGSDEFQPVTQPSRLDCTGYAPPIDAWLELRAGTDGRERLALPVGLRRFGAEADNDVVVKHRGIARYHAAFEHTCEHDVYVSDLTRRDPGDVRVNGRAVKRQRLRDGDVVGIGGCDVIYRCVRRDVGNAPKQQTGRN